MGRSSRDLELDVPMTFPVCLIKKQVSYIEAGSGKQVFGSSKTGLSSEIGWFNW